MKKITISIYLLLGLFLAGCRAPTPVATVEIPSTDAAIATEESSLPLSNRGQYSIGTREITISDSKRDGQKILISLIFPGTEDKPDLSGAPYPVVIYSQGGDANDSLNHRYDNNGTLNHLASYGYFVVAPQHETVPELLLTDRPLDIVAVMAELKRLAAADYSGMLDLDRIGMMSISAGTATTLQIAGGRIDYSYFDAWCEKRPSSVFCDAGIVAQGRKEVAGTLPVDADGLYYIEGAPPLRAVALLSPCFQPLFGKRGMAFVTVPALLLAPTKDEFCDYQDQTVTLYQDLGSKDRYLVNLVNNYHSDPLKDTANQKMMVTAFFGYFLKRQQDYAQYQAEDFVNTVKGLSWGVYQP